MTYRILLVAVALLLSASATAKPTFMPLIAYVERDGAPLDGDVSIEVRVRDASASGGTLVGSDVQLTVVGGLLVLDLVVDDAALAQAEPNPVFAVTLDGEEMGVIPLGEVPYARSAAAAEAVAWGGVTGVPAGFADDVDNDTTYSAGSGLVLTGTTFAVGDGAITATHLAPNSVGASEIAAAGVGTSELADGAVTSAKLASGAVGSSQLANNSVAAAHLLANSVGLSEIATGSVDTDELVDGAVTSAKIAAGAVGSAAIADGSIANADIGGLAVGNPQLGNNAVTTGKIKDGEVKTDDIASSAVTSTKIAAGAVGTSQLAGLAVTTEKIANSAVSSGKILNNSIARTDISGTEVTVYQKPADCGGGLTTSTSCETIACGFDSGLSRLKFYNCSGSCNVVQTPATCTISSSAKAGYLLSPTIP